MVKSSEIIFIIEEATEVNYPKKQANTEWIKK